jgi:amino acid transporter
MLSKIKDYMIGSPLETRALAHTRLNKIRALAAFSPDALSSIAYANQEIYLGLVIAGAAGLSLAWPIGIAIVGVLVIASVSYYQTIHAYPSGGGSYIVARENLGTLLGLVAAAALMIDYLLVAAVSLTAGVEAIASALPVLWPYRVWLSLFLLLVITIINLRGIQETGSFMSIPVYMFLFTYIPMLIYGLVRLLVDGPTPLAAAAPPAQLPLTAFLVMHAFAAGCTALTGIEAISNGVPAFKKPESKHAGQTLIVMSFLMGFLFLGSIGLTQFFGVVAGPEETILSALARKLLGSSIPYFVIQISTMLILTVAANTSFADFPRVAAILAKDGFLPRQLTALGERLVYANGITVLSAGTAVLIVVFRGDTHALVPLFAVGAFLAFTLSQGGMVLHWLREKGRGWTAKMIANGVGALATGTTLVIIGISKFREGAWITVLVIPLLVIFFLRIRSHYSAVSEQLTLKGLPPSLKPLPPPRVIIPISGLHRGIFDAIAYAQSISKDITAVYVELDPGMGDLMRQRWQRWFPDIKLAVVPSPYRSIVKPLLDFIQQADEEANDGQLATVMLPEFVPAKWYQGLLHNQTAFILRTALLYRRREAVSQHQRVIVDIPYHLKR